MRLPDTRVGAALTVDIAPTARGLTFKASDWLRKVNALWCKDRYTNTLTSGPRKSTRQLGSTQCVGSRPPPLQVPWGLPTWEVF